MPNVEFLKGTIEDVPLPDAAVDVVISNCVINLSTDKPAVLSEMFRVLTPGGRIGITDVVAEDTSRLPSVPSVAPTSAASPARCPARSTWTASPWGFVDAEVTYTHEAAPGMHSALIRATKPAQGCGAAT